MINLEYPFPMQNDSCRIQEKQFLRDADGPSIVYIFKIINKQDYKAFSYFN